MPSQPCEGAKVAEDLQIAGVESAADDLDGAEMSDTDTKDAAQEGVRRAMRRALSFGAAAAVTVAAVVGWFGYQAYQCRQADQQRELFLRVGQQGALNLTTISHTEVDADIRRILDSSTGEFHDDMQRRSQPYVDLVKREQSKSAGTITDAGLESVTGDSARVLVSVSVATTTAAVPQTQVNSFRMRIDVQRVADGAKVSKVTFIG
jgi:Mce-associated membrane protein